MFTLQLHGVPSAQACGQVLAACGLRLAAAGHAPFIRRTLRTAALAEIAIYRDVSRAVMAHLGRILGRARPKAAVLAAGIWAVYAWGAARRLAAHGVAAHAGPPQRAGRPGAPRSLRLIPATARYHRSVRRHVTWT